MKKKKKISFGSKSQFGIVTQMILVFALLLTNALSVMALSNVKVKGVVRSASDNIPLIGVTVIQKGTTNGAVTDIDGNYELSIPIDAEIRFSYLGYIDQEQTITAGKTVYDVFLQENMQLLDEVIVVGYGIQKKSVVTAAVSRVSGDELVKENPTNVQNALKGKTSGVQITSNSGQPGMDSKIRIRGIGTVNDSDPLYVIDGMPSSNGINYLNPSDIESVEILKDAASAAIYGARGANGVILVTTKKGTSNSKTIFNYEFSYGFQNPSNKANPLGSADYQLLTNEASNNSGHGNYFTTASSVNTDWQKELTYNNAPLVNHRFSLTGGGERNTYYASLGIVDQSGIFAKGYADFTRYNARFNATQTLLDTKERNWLNKIVLGAKVSYSRSQTKGSNINNNESSGIIASMNMLPPTDAIYQTDANVIANYKNIYPNYVTADDGRVYNIIGAAVMANPFALLKVHNNRLDEPQVFNGNFDLNFTILPGLIYKTTADFEWGHYSERSVAPAYDLNTNQTNRNSNVYNYLGESFTWQWENIVQYNKSFDKHNLGLLAGTTLSSNFYHDINGTRHELNEVSLDKGFLNISGATPGDPLDRVNGDASDHKLASVFGRLSYNYDEKYLFEATVRHDGSSNFGINKRFATFPSVSAGWVLTGEKFMENRPKWFDFAKIRGSWGQNGNEAIGAFGYTTLIVTGDYRAVIDDQVVQGAKPGGYSNPNLKWETSEQTDLGIDLRFFNSLSLSADWFDKQTKDMLCWVALPDYAGFASILTNKGTVSNKGWEFDVSYKFKAGEVNLGVSANASYVKNIVTDQGSDTPQGLDAVGNGMTSTVTWRANGEPYGYFYGYVHDGIFQNQAEVDASHQADAVIGGIRWKDMDGVQGITDGDRTNIGNPNPDWTYGLTLSADWKGFDFNAFFQGVQGNEIYKLYRLGNVPLANWDKAWLGRWHGEGTSNWYPILYEGNTTTAGKPTGANETSNLYVEDGSYVRFKVLQLGYTLPKAITQKALIERLRFFVQGENLFTLTDYTGLDPEVGTRNGFDGGTYPQARIFTFGVNLTF